MKKLMVLDTKRAVVKVIAFKLTNCEINIHFAKNLMEGGRPDRFDDTMIGTQEGV